MQNFEKRIGIIFGKQCDRNNNTIKKYYHYLVKQIQLPCYLTGLEDFPWEELYILGGWSKKEYEKLKQEKPSYTDQYELLKILEPKKEDEDIFVRVKRLSDKKEFEIGLDWLKTLHSKDKNFQLLDDYAVWHTNY